METKSIMIVGVGGQGTLLASRILGNVLLSQGYDVKVSEVHGMSQRGGSVVTYVKFGDKVHSPIVGKGEADWILAFELLEAYRALPYLKTGGKMITNCQSIAPMPVITGAASYPQGIAQTLEKAVELVQVNALELAQKAGNTKAVNVVLIGVLAAASGIDKQAWLKALEATVPAKLLEVNQKAFELGYTLKK